MRIAYLIFAHHQPQHLGALIERLDDSNARFFVHLNQRSDIVPFRNAIRSERAILLDERLPIEWGEWNMVQATLDLLRRAHQQSPRAVFEPANSFNSECAATGTGWSFFRRAG
jgi:hypothetical protein